MECFILDFIRNPESEPKFEATSGRKCYVWSCTLILSYHYCSNSTIGTSSASLPTMALATFHTWIRLSSAALQSTQGSFKFQLKSDIRFVWPPCINRLESMFSFKIQDNVDLILTVRVGHPPHLPAFALRRFDWDPKNICGGHNLHSPGWILQKDARPATWQNQHGRPGHVAWTVGFAGPKCQLNCPLSQ